MKHLDVSYKEHMKKLQKGYDCDYFKEDLHRIIRRKIKTEDKESLKVVEEQYVYQNSIQSY